MSKFSYLKSFDVKDGKEVDYPMHMLPGCPVLKVLPATEANKNYWKAFLKLVNKKKQYKRKDVTPSLVKENRSDDRVFFAKYIVKGWSSMNDIKTKKPIPYTDEDCLDFMSQLPDHLFDDLREFCADPNTFVEFVDEDEIAKN